VYVAGQKKSEGDVESTLTSNDRGAVSVSYSVRYSTGGGDFWQNQGGYLSLNQAISNAKSKRAMLVRQGFRDAAVRVVEVANGEEAGTVWSA